MERDRQLAIKKAREKEEDRRRFVLHSDGSESHKIAREKLKANKFCNTEHL